MDALALSRKLDSLEKSWSGLDSLLNFWTLLVVAGVVIEVFVLVIEYRHEWKDFRRGTIHTPDKPSLLLFLLGMAGATLVAIGVAGEFRIHVEAGKIETDIRDNTRQLVSLADADAAKASERASKNEKDAAEIRLRAEHLAELLAWRTISKEQAVRLTKNLAPFAGQRIDVFWYADDAEAEQFSNQLIEIFKGAKWDAGFGKIIVYGKLLYGVKVDVGAENQEVIGITVARLALDAKGREAARILASALKREGFGDGAIGTLFTRRAEGALSIGSVPMSEAPIRITVGIKPRQQERDTKK